VGGPGLLAEALLLLGIRSAASPLVQGQVVLRAHWIEMDESATWIYL
jgi:hypothetical protein